MDELSQLILQFQEQAQDNNTETADEIRNKIESNIKQIKINNEDEIFVLAYLIESIIDLSTKEKHILSFEQILTDIYQNPSIYPVMNVINQNCFPHERNMKTKKLLYFFYSNK